MPLSYYADVHVPSAIVEGLRRRGIDVMTSQEDGTRQASDDELLRRATALGRLLVSQDEDLLDIAAAWQAAGWEYAGLIFAPQGGASIGQYVDDLELVAHCCETSEVAGQIYFLPLA
jgi:Domain of unknown function (DUF5615)